MRHLAKIQVEFLKAARDWDEMSYDEQKTYLQQHRKSKRKITARPESKTTEESPVWSKIDSDESLNSSVDEMFSTEDLEGTELKTYQKLAELVKKQFGNDIKVIDSDENEEIEDKLTDLKSTLKEVFYDKNDVALKLFDLGGKPAIGFWDYDGKRTIILSGAKLKSKTIGIKEKLEEKRKIVSGDDVFSQQGLRKIFGKHFDTLSNDDIDAYTTEFEDDDGDVKLPKDSVFFTGEEDGENSQIGYLLQKQKDGSFKAKAYGGDNFTFNKDDDNNSKSIAKGDMKSVISQIKSFDTKKNPEGYELYPKGNRW